MLKSTKEQAILAGAKYLSITQRLINGKWLNWCSTFYTDSTPDENGMFHEVGYRFSVTTVICNLTITNIKVPSSYFKDTEKERILPFIKLID